MTHAVCNFHSPSHYPIMCLGKKTNRSWKGSRAVAEVRVLSPHSVAFPGSISVDRDQKGLWTWEHWTVDLQPDKIQSHISGKVEKPKDPRDETHPLAPDIC